MDDDKDVYKGIAARLAQFLTVARTVITMEAISDETFDASANYLEGKLDKIAEGKKKYFDPEKFYRNRNVLKQLSNDSKRKN